MYIASCACLCVVYLFFFSFLIGVECVACCSCVVRGWLLVVCCLSCVVWFVLWFVGCGLFVDRCLVFVGHCLLHVVC